MFYKYAAIMASGHDIVFNATDHEDAAWMALFYANMEGDELEDVEPLYDV
tara:strand:+ start:215 stop:364 length:150 start_codon:yes stop_codon:yes gene_type:complete